MIYVCDSELYHHGVQGQKWGQRNGPPYPLSSSVSTGTRLKEGAGKKKKAGGIVGYIKRKKAAKKRVKALAKARKVRAANVAEKKRQAEFEKNKQKILQFDKDTNKAAREVLRNAKDLTNSEINDVATRLQKIEDIKKYVKDEPSRFERFQKRIDKVVDVADWSEKKISSGIRTWNTIARVANSMQAPGEEPIMPIIRDLTDFKPKGHS